MSTAEGDGPAHASLWRNPNFLRYFVGTFVTNVGDSLYSVGILWLVYQVGGAEITGIASAMLLLPWLLQALAGPVADRFRARPLLVGAQAAQGATVLVVALAAAAGHLSVALLLAVIPVLSLATLLEWPVGSRLVPQIVAEERLAEGNSALATVTLGLDMVFDAVGGVLVGLVGVTALFLLDTAAFAVAGVLFLSLSLARDGGEADPDAAEAPPDDGTGPETTEDGGAGKPAGEGPDDGTGSPTGATAGDDSALRAYLADLRDGVEVLRGTLFVDLILTGAVSNFAVGVTLATLPAFGAARGGAAVYGLTLGALGVGRLVGSAAGSRLDGLPYGRLTGVAFLAGAVLWVGAAYAPTTPLVVVLFALAWIPAGVNGVLTSTLNQRVFPVDLLGRVSSLKGTAKTWTLPVGSLAGGVLTGALGPTTTLGLAAGGFAFVGGYVLLRRPLRRLPAVDDVEPADLGLAIDPEDVAAAAPEE